MKQKMKKVICMAVIGALAITSAVGNNVTSQAAKKIKLSKKSVTVTAKKSKTVTIKNVKAKQVKKLTVKSSKKNIATAKKSGKTKVKVTGKKAGSAKVTVKVTLKGKKKATKLTLKVTVKKAATTNKVTPTLAPTNSPAVSGTPAPSATATTAVNPTDAPATDAPATDAPATNEPNTTLKPTKTPKPSPSPTGTPNIIDLDKYDFNIIDELWTNDFYERTNNSDGSVTLTRGSGEQSWQVGEFGFKIPRDKVGDVHQFTRIIVKYRDSDLTDDTTKCGFVFHMGDDTEVGWIESEDGGHPNTLSFDGTGETVIEATETKSGISESNFSTIRIFDGKLGGKITIESVRLEKGTTTTPTTPPVESGGIESGNVDTGNVDTGSVESPEPTATVTPVQKVDTDIDLTNANSTAAGPLFESDYSTDKGSGFENEDGSITYYTTAKYSGGGLNFYLNKDKSHFDMTKYSKIQVTLSAEQEGHQVYLGLITDGKVEQPWGVVDAAIDAKPNAYPMMTGNGEDNVYEIDLTQMEIPQNTDKGPDCGVVSLQIKYNGYQQPEETQVCVTVKSIKFIK